MGLQARMTENDPRLYNANRDVAHGFSFFTKAALDKLVSRRWDAAEAVLESALVDDDDVAAAAEAFVTFATTVADDPAERMQDVLVRSGWDAADRYAQLVIMAYLGTVVMGVYFAGAREATLRGPDGHRTGPTQDTQALEAAGRRAVDLLTVPRWRRGLVRAWWRIGRICREIKRTA